MSLLNDLTAITTPALTDIVYCVQNGTDYKVTNEQLITLSKTNMIIPKTQAQYDALTPAEKSNGALYIITDAVITADDIEYSSGVSVADKIDGIIDDTTTSQDTTWSSDKISGEIGKPLPLSNITYSGTFVSTGFSDTGSRILLYVSFPFLMANTNYNLSCSRANITGTGIFTSGVSVDTKYTTGCLIIVTTSATAGRAYGGVVDLSFS